MTEKISAGYFDSNRGEPIYVGDVYKEDGAMIPYHKVIKDAEKGFMVEHVGTTEKFSLTTEAKNLIKKTYLGNVFDTPDWNELVGNKNTETTELNRHPQSEPDELPENTPEDVKNFLEGKTDELPEGTEIMSTAEAEELEKQAKEIENTATEENSETEPEETGDAVVSADATTGPKTDEPENKTTEETKDEPKTEDKKSESLPIDIVASCKEEKNLQEKRNDYQKHIDALKRKNDELETEAVRYENLASTLTFEPFVELKMLTSNAVQDYAKKQDIKECEKHLKNYKTIDSIESLLKEYEDMAEKNRANIELNNKDIDNYEIKITEINDKLNNFQRKLALDTPADNSEELQPETVKNDNKSEEIKAEDSQSESDITTSKTDTTNETEEKSENQTTPETETEETGDAEQSEDGVPF